MLSLRISKQSSGNGAPTQRPVEGPGHRRWHFVVDRLAFLFCSTQWRSICPVRSGSFPPMFSWLPPQLRRFGLLKVSRPPHLGSRSGFLLNQIPPPGTRQGGFILDRSFLFNHPERGPSLHLDSPRWLQQLQLPGGITG